MDAERNNILNGIELCYNELYNFTINYGKNNLNDIQYKFFSHLKNLQELRNNENYKEGISKLDNEGLIIYKNKLSDLLSNIKNRMLTDIVPQNNEIEITENEKYHKILIQDKGNQRNNDVYLHYGNKLSLNEARGVIEKLRTQSTGFETRLAQKAITRIVRDGWINITNNQQRRIEIALSLKEKMLDENTRDHWIIDVTSIYIPGFPVEEERTSEQGANLDSNTGKPLGPAQRIVHYDGYIFQVYVRNSETNRPATSNPRNEYYDVDGNGRIDFEK